ncbi:PREDICTED: F-box protein At4g00893-like [Camelina sativa]|uniref:F-box protein At4g00893-like n=1 Tax=Camelina sativa TaxID=90675 RepID=A0ABM0WBJ6_CAMSA|nr:PREDICTED: F-box protein At4g00893-like [Camelina sativa]
MASPSSMSPATVSRRGSRSPSKKALMNPSFADLPSDLLRMIMSHLVLEDNIHASGACKSWCEAAVSVRVVEKHPWLMCFRKRGNLVELRDPLQWKLYTLSLPELAESTVCYSRDGWLLMDKTGSKKDVFFFNPFSRELITMPECELEFDTIAFSCSPTSDNCVVVAIRFTYYSATISTCHPGDDKWVTATFPCHGIGVYKRSNLVYQNDRFYCINAAGFLSNFHPSSGTWSGYCVHRLRSPYMYDRNQYGRKAKAVALAEKEGELFVMYACMNEKPMVYKLVSMKWEEVSETTLDSLTIFFSFHNSELRTNLPWMRSKVYFSRFGYNRKRCLSYSFDKSMYNRKRRASYSCDESMCRPGEESRSWIELCRPQILWIDPPPKNLLDLMLSSSHNN